MTLAQKILNESWGDYDERKIRAKQTRRHFDADEEWEVNFLKQLIKKYYPACTDAAIHKAINTCCTTMPAPRFRIAFVENVMANLKGEKK